MHKTYRHYIANFYRHFAIFYIPISVFSAPANMTFLEYSFDKNKYYFKKSTENIF